MHLDPIAIAALTKRETLDAWLRVLRSQFAATPLGCGFGPSRFSSPSNAFKVIYLGQTMATAIAETVIRDRFEAVSPALRVLDLSEISTWAVAELHTSVPLRLLDLTEVGALRLGLNTDAVGAKAHQAGQAFSEALHAQFSDIDGIQFLSRLTRGRCMAVYERSIAPCLKAKGVVGLEQAVSLTGILVDLGITLNDDL